MDGDLSPGREDGMPEPVRRFSYEEIGNGALILSLLRDCDTFEALCGRFEYALPADLEMNTTAMALRNQLRTLRTLGLVEFEEREAGGKMSVVNLKPTPLWQEIR